jgi:hypothetical protein
MTFSAARRNLDEIRLAGSVVLADTSIHRGRKPHLVAVLQVSFITSVP